MNGKVRGVCIVAASFFMFDSSAAAANDFELKLLARYELSADGGGAEIVQYDAQSKTLYVVGGNKRQVARIDVSTPASPRTLLPLRIPDVPDEKLGDEVTSVAIKNGVVAASVPAATKTEPGFVAFFDEDGLFVTAVKVGCLPDMVTFSPDGKMLLTANEGEPNSDYTNDPEGSVSIIDFSTGVLKVDQSRVRTIGFESIDRASLDPSVRVFGPNATPAQDFEPEYITMSADCTRAWVSLQENNAIAELDVPGGRVTAVYGLGFRDFNRPGGGFDPSDRDGQINIQPWPAFGMYQPDSIAQVSINGKQYLVTANEGDLRVYDGFDETARVEEIKLDETKFPSAAELQRPDQLGRLNVTTTLGDTDGDGDYDALYAFGTRSLSIWEIGTNSLQQVFDSGDQFERIIAELRPDLYDRANPDGSTLDDRSDNSGPEPEGLALGEINGRMYAFIGLERAGGVIAYDITEPSAARFVCYTNSQSMDGSQSAQDVGPEGIIFVSSKESPTNSPLVILANEVSGTILVYEVLDE